MKNKRFIFLLFSICTSFFVNAQSCSGCTTLISQTDTSDYVVNVGQTLCIDTSGSCLGKITLNGGTLCNKGFLNAKELVLTSGAIYNYSNITYTQDLTLPNAITITINDGSVLNVNGNLTLNGCTVFNSGFINVDGNIESNSGVLNNYKVINCNLFNGSSAINSGIINKN